VVASRSPVSEPTIGFAHRRLAGIGYRCTDADRSFSEQSCRIGAIETHDELLRDRQGHARAAVGYGAVGDGPGGEEVVTDDTPIGGIDAGSPASSEVRR
jgi:hypothetical protein